MRRTPSPAPCWCCTWAAWTRSRTCTGIHGHHLNHFEYVATDNEAQTIIAVTATNPDGSKTEYVSSDWKGPG